MNVFNGILAIAAAVAVYFTVIPYWDPGVQISLPPVKGTMAETYTLSPLPQKYLSSRLCSHRRSESFSPGEKNSA